MITKLPHELRRGDRVAVEGGGSAHVWRAEPGFVSVATCSTYAEVPVVRVALGSTRDPGGVTTVLADPRVPVVLA